MEVVDQKLEPCIVPMAACIRTVKLSTVAEIIKVESILNRLEIGR